jgi:hypothetical protein
MPTFAWALLLCSLAAATAVVAVRFRRSARLSIALADAKTLRREARRTALLRAAGAVVVTGLVALGVAVVPQVHAGVFGRTTAAPSTIVVLDVSGSISQPAYRTIASTLESVAAGSSGGRRAGLIIFSDFAQEALPPDSPPAELRPFEKFFIPLPTRLGATHDVQFPQNPWFQHFSGGTVISSGLAMARLVAHRDHVPHARVLLVSDLSDDAGDTRNLDRELLTFASDSRLDLRAVALPPSSPADQQRFSRNLGVSSILVHPGRTIVVTQGSSGHLNLPVAFLVLVAVIALALALDELAAATIDWRGTVRAGAEP